MSGTSIASLASFLARAVPAVSIVVALGAGCAEPVEDGPPPGYRRFEPTPVPLPPGASGQWVQYVGEPLTEDMDVLDILGGQGPGGHHGLLYATAGVEPIGTTREWTAIDQISDRFVGGVGPEGVPPTRLPDGVVFRIPRGNALYVNTHYINAGDSELMGTTRIDVKLAPSSPERLVAGLFTNVDLQLVLPAQQMTTRSSTCTIGRDLDLVMFTNHMHYQGVSTRTTITPPGGDVVVIIKDDPVWSSEWGSNPNYARKTVAEPLHLIAGTTVTTQCTWLNTGNRDLRFPDEMCVFISFQLGGRDVNCVDGAWTE